MSATATRKALPSDLPALYGLLRAKAEFDGATHALTATEAEFGQAIFGEEPGLEVAVADRDGSIVGFAAYYPIFSTFSARPGLWLEDLFVDSSCRSLGIGRDLLKFVGREAVNRGCCKLEWSLQKSNTKGIAFYEREGAHVRENNRFAKLDQAGLDRLIAP